MRPTPATSASTASPDPDGLRWFSEEVRPHEASLRSYLQGRFPAVRDIDDVVQESYLRIWKARAAHPIRCAQAFLFTVARRLALDTLRHQRASPIEGIGRLDDLPVMADTLDAAEAAGRRERIRVLAEGIATLPTRCREVFILHKIQGRSRRETAQCLGLAEKTVEAQTTKAIERCREYLRRRGVTAWFE